MTGRSSASPTAPPGSSLRLVLDGLGSSVANTGNPSSPFLAATGPMTGTGGGATNAINQRIIQEAQKAVQSGKMFKPGETNRCQDFVNTIIQKATGKEPPITKRPIDGLSTGPLMASRVFGSDVAKIVTDVSEMKPGMVVAIDTGQDGKSRDGGPVIGHVGIISKVEGGVVYMIDRSTNGGGAIKERLVENVGRIIAAADISSSLGATNT